MDEKTFIDGSRPTWDRLGSALERARHGGVASMGAPEVRALYEDYRRAASDLAYAQTHFPDSRTEVHLNRLVGEAHAELYGSAPRRVGELWAFVTVGYPRLLRRHGRTLMLAAGVMLAAVALGYLLAYVNYPLARIFIPEAMRDGLGDAVERGADLPDIAAAIAPLLAAGITVNNIQVALLAFAGGMTFGALTIYAIIANGLMLGALAGVFAKAGESLYFWSLILPHGSLELPAIALAAGAGLIMGRALVAPGDLPRGAALRAVSGDAVRVVLGTVPLFVLAGIVEGFITPSAIDPLLKLGFGVTAAALLAAYVGLAGRGAEHVVGAS